MKKTKRILSLLTALTITASAFASLAIPASAADTTYLEDDLNSYTETGISAQGTAEQTATLGNFNLAMGARGSGGDGVSIISIDKEGSNSFFKILSGKYASSQRGASISFASSLNIPDFASIDAGNVLELSFDAKFTDAASTIQIMGVTSSETTGNGAVVNDPYLCVAKNAQIPTDEWVKVSVNVTNDKKGYATLTDAVGKLVSAKSFTASGDKIEKIVFYGASTTVYMDNISVKQVANTYKNLTVNVTDPNSAAIKATTIKVDRATALLDDGGSVSLDLPAGKYAIEASASGYEANAGEKDAAKDTAVIGSEDVEKTLVLSEQTYIHEPKTVTMAGGQLVMTAPREEDKLESAAFTVESVYDQNDVDRTSEASIAWSVSPANDHVSIDHKGVLTVTKGFKPASGRVQEFTVKATASMEKTEVTADATAKISIADYYFYEPGVGGASYGGTVRKLNNGETTLVLPPTKTTEDIEIPEEIAFEKGTGKQLTFKTQISEKGLYTFARTISLKDTDGNVIIGPIDVAGPASADGMGIGFGFGYTDNGGGWSADGAKKWYGFSSNTWVTVNMTFVTYSSGATKITVKVNDDGDEFTYDVPEEATGIKTISLTSAAAADYRYVALKDILIDDADVSGVDISGPDKFTSIGGNTVTKTYTAEAVLIEDDETFTWTTTIENATITPDPDDSTKATLTVPDTVTAGGMITVTSSKSTTENPKTSTKAVAITPATIASYDLVGSKTLAYEDGLTESYAITNVKDQNGDDITEYVIPTWSIKGAEPVTVPKATIPVEKTGNAVAIFTTYAENALESVSVKPINIPADATSVDIEGAPGQRVMIWDSLDNMEPIGTGAVEITGEAPSVTYITNSGTLTVNEKENVTLVASAIGKTIEIPVTIADFSKIIDAEAGDVDVSDLVTYGTKTFSVVLDNGTVLTKTADVDDKITLTAAELGDAVEAEVIPVYKFDLGGASDSGYVKVEDTKADGYGFTNDATPTAGTGTGIQSKGVDLDGNSFEVDLPDGRYDMTFYKADTIRTHIRVNDYMTVTEADFQDGDDGTADPLAGPGVYTKLDVNVTGGVAKINAYEWGKGTPLMSAVEITKKSEDFQPRKTHIWIAGDSTVCIYRPSPTTDSFAAGTRRTGWGQLLQNYLSDDVIVDDFAHSGDWADNWYKNTFPSVLQHAEAGDYLIIQFGINDRARTPEQKVMSAALSNMIDECRAKGVIPVLQTPELCVSQYGTQVTEEHTKPTGSGHAGYFEVNRTVAKEKNALLIDLADISATMWATMGKTWVSRNYFLWNASTNEQLDAQHMSYNGAKLVASMVATEILDQQAAGKKGAAGESFDGIPVNAKVQSNVTYTDASDNTEKTIERMAAEFKPSTLAN